MLNLENFVVLAVTKGNSLCHRIKKKIYKEVKKVFEGSG